MSDGNQLDLDAVVLDIQGKRRLHAAQSGLPEDCVSIAERAAADLVDQGAEELLQDARR